MNSVSCISKASAIAEVANTLLINSGALLRLVVDFGDVISEEVNSLKLYVPTACKRNCEPSEIGCLDAQISREAKNRSGGVVQLSVQAAMSIRRIVGLNDRPYLPEQQNYFVTLISIEKILVELSSEACVLACSCVDENFVDEVHQRILAMSVSAGTNIKIAKTILFSVESLSNLALAMSRMNKL